MKAVKKKKKNVFVRIALIALSIYVIVSLIQLQLQLNEGQRAVNALDAQIQAQNSYNEQLRDKTENPEEYLEKQARKQGKAKPGETILQVIPNG